MKYAVVFERGPSSVGSRVPDLPGCVAVARPVWEWVYRPSSYSSGDAFLPIEASNTPIYL